MTQRWMILSTGLILGLICRLSALEFIAYGDTRTNISPHQAVVDAFAEHNPPLVIHSGDLWDGYSSDQWRNILTKNADIASLLNNNQFLVARGNHESEGAVLNFNPRIVRDGNIEYSFTEDNCFFVCMGIDPGANTSWLEHQLQSSAATAADWRFVFAHYPVYSSGGHGASGKSNFEQLCDQYNVNAFFAGHDHHYERSYLIHDGQPLSKADDIDYQDQGTIYFVTGGGGAPLRGVGSNWWTASAMQTYHYCQVDAQADMLTIRTRKPDGSVIDQVVLRRESTVPDISPPTITSVAPVDEVYTTSVTLRVETDENAFVRWSTSDRSYSDMSNQFTQGEGGTSHAVDVTVTHGSTYTYYVRARDEAGNAMDTSAVISFTVDTACVMASWMDRRYDDSAWKLGQAEIGYGDGNEATKTAKVNTLYLRHAFMVADATALSGLSAAIKYDDGIVVYLNGDEIKRLNMDSGDPDYGTYSAGSHEGGSFENVDLSSAASLLVDGDNVLAAEVHQRSSSSSDISFDLALTSGSTPLVSSGSTWRYYDEGKEPEDIATCVTLTEADPRPDRPARRSLRVARGDGRAVYVRLSAPFPDAGHVSLLSPSGKLISSAVLPAGMATARLDQLAIRTGTYVIVVRNAGARLAKAIVLAP